MQVGNKTSSAVNGAVLFLLLCYVQQLWAQQTLSYTASTVAAPYTTPMTIGVNQASSLTHTRSLSAGVYSVRATAASKAIVYES